MKKLISVFIFSMCSFFSNVYASSLPSIQPTKLGKDEQIYKIMGLSQWILYGISIIIICLIGIKGPKMRKENVDTSKIIKYILKMGIICIICVVVGTVLGWFPLNMLPPLGEL